MDNATKKTLGVLLLLRHTPYDHASDVPSAGVQPVVPPIFIPVTTGVPQAQLQDGSCSL